MSITYDINSMCLRYIVPFRINESFEQAYKKVESQREKIRKKDKVTGEKRFTGEYKNVWSRKVITMDGPESDLYGYIRNEFRFDDNIKELPEQKTGCEWIFWRSDESNSKDGQKIKKLLYFPDGIFQQGKVSTQCRKILISNVGLLLFRNSLGFFWYEIKTSQMNSRQLMLFQNRIKELNHGHIFLWERSKTEPEYGFVCSEENGVKTYMRPVSLGKWIQDMLSFLDISYFAERKGAYGGMLKKSRSNMKRTSYDVVCKDMTYQDTNIKSPDKTILFTYASLNNKNYGATIEEKQSLVYHITNGYNASYHFSKSAVDHMKCPFDDAYWYATQEGASYLVWSSYDNSKVFSNLIPNKIRTDYFVLYLKVLYQSFSLLIYAERTQNNISAIDGKELTLSSSENVTGVFREINLFLTKSMATSVSHIHHQSDFYNYLKKRLRVYEDVQSVTAGLKALEFLQHEQQKEEELKEKEKNEEREKIRDGKIQAIMGIFAMLGISSALVDCFDFIEKFSEDGEWQSLSKNIQGIELLFIAIIGLISAVAIRFAWKAVIDAFKDKNDKVR